MLPAPVVFLPTGGQRTRASCSCGVPSHRNPSLHLYLFAHKPEIMLSLGPSGLPSLSCGEVLLSVFRMQALNAAIWQALPEASNGCLRQHRAPATSCCPAILLAFPAQHRALRILPVKPGEGTRKTFSASCSPNDEPSGNPITKCG